MMEPVGFADPVDVAGHCQSSVQLRRRTHCRAHPRERGTDGYADNRYYDLYSGQFLSVDPMDGQTNQPYEFANDDPINVGDPLGLECEPSDDIGHGGIHQFPGIQAGKSQFFDSEDLSALSDTGESQGILQANGYTQFVLHATDNVGIDRTTGLPTNIYTVIKNSAGNVVTLFPGTSAVS